MKLPLKIAVISLLLLNSFAYAQQPDSVPKLINYQGKLTNAEGMPLQNGNYEVRFTLWDAASGGNLVWGETRAVTLVAGVFNVALGGDGSQPVAGAPVNVIAYAFGSKDRYLETTLVSGPGVAQEQTLAPRQQMVSVPFAYLIRRKRPKTRQNWPVNCHLSGFPKARSSPTAAKPILRAGLSATDGTSCV